MVFISLNAKHQKENSQPSRCTRDVLGLLNQPQLLPRVYVCVHNSCIYQDRNGSIFYLLQLCKAIFKNVVPYIREDTSLVWCFYVFIFFAAVLCCFSQTIAHPCNIKSVENCCMGGGLRNTRVNISELSLSEMKTFLITKF